MTSETGWGFGVGDGDQQGSGGLLGALGAAASLLSGAASGTIRLARRQPLLAAGVGAAALGIAGGIALAEHTRTRPAAQHAAHVGGRVRRRAARAESPLRLRSIRAVPALLAPLLQLLGNPIVQAYLRRAVVTALARRFSPRR